MDPVTHGKRLRSGKRVGSGSGSGSVTVAVTHGKRLRSLRGAVAVTQWTRGSGTGSANDSGNDSGRGSGASELLQSFQIRFLHMK